MQKGFRAIELNIDDVDNEWYKNLSSYCKILEGVARVTRQCLHLVDFYKGEVLYVSNNPIFLAGLSPVEVKNLGWKFSKLYITQEQNIQILEIINSWFSFIDEKPKDERTLYTLSYDYYLNDKLIHATMNPVFLSKDNKPWIVLVKSKISIKRSSGNAVILKYNSDISWKYIKASRKWREVLHPILSDIEKSVLLLSIQGKKEKEICDEIYRSLDGLKSIKRRLFHKLDARNIAEAVSRAISSNLL